MTPGAGNTQAAAARSDDGSRPQLELDFDDFRVLLEELSPNISKIGMFFATEEPHPAGTEVEFDVRLAGGSVLLGRGEVVWSAEAGNGRPAGVGIRFDKVNSEGRTLIQRIVEVRTDAGQETFDLEPATEERPVPEEVSAEHGAQAEGDPSESEELREELRRAQEEGQKLRAELEAERAAKSELETQLSDAEARVRETIAAGDELGERLRSAEEAHRNDRARLEEALLDKLGFEHKLGEKEEVIARFQEATGHAAAERDRLAADRQALGAKLDGFEARIAESEAERDTLRKELAELQDEARGQSSELQAAHDARAELQESVERAQAEVDAARAQADEEERRTEEARREIERLESQVAEARERTEALESEAEMLRGENERARSAMESELEAERKAAVKSRKLAERVRAEHEALQEELAETQARVEELETRLGGEAGVAGPTEPGEDAAAGEPLAGSDSEPAEAEVLEGQDDSQVAEEVDEKRESASLWASLSESFGRSRHAADDDPEASAE